MSAEPPKVKHGGCADCGSKADPILTSVSVAFAESKAVCSRCLPKYPNGVRR